jgi:hypothetical protein
MATTVAQAFQILKSNLEITSLQSSTVSTRQTNVRSVIEAGLKVVDPFSFLAGSYMRSTMIAPLKEADVDIFVVLDASYYYHFNGQNGGQGGLLDLVKQTLKKTYTKTPDISRNGQAVTVRFDDFVVDVVPAFNRTGGGYLIPNSVRQAWIETDPLRHIELFTAANKARNGDLIPVIKMIKAWNRGHSSYFRSFHLEVLALEILKNVTITDFPSGIRYFFDKARTLVAHQNPDPAGYPGDIGAYIDTPQKIQEAGSRFQTAFDRAFQAEEFARQGYTRTAIEGWQQIFNGYFPAYG